MFACVARELLVESNEGSGFLRAGEMQGVGEIDSAFKPVELLSTISGSSSAMLGWPAKPRRLCTISPGEKP